MITQPQLPNYGAQYSDPFAASIQGLKLVTDLEDLELKKNARQIALERQKTLNESLVSLWGKDNPTAQDFLKVASILPEKEAEQMRKNWDALSTERQQNEIRFSGQLLSAFAAEQPQVAIDLMKQRSQAEANAGRKAEAQMWDVQAKMAEINPKVGLKSVGMMLAALPGSEKTLQSVLSVYKAPAETRKVEAEATEKEVAALGLPAKQKADLSKTEAEVSNLQSQIEERAARLRLDKDKLQSEIELKLQELNQKGTKLTPESIKTVNDMVVNATASDNAASKMFDLAAKLDAAGTGGYGGLSSVAEWLASATGNQDEWSAMRSEYARLKNQAALKMLPPGPASDKDIMMAQKGMPSENADSRIMSQFLRGMAKMQIIDSVSKNAQADWINSVGSLTRTKQDIQIGDTIVPKNTPFQTYLNAILNKQVLSKTNEQSAKSAAETRQKSYMRHWERR